MTAGSAWAQFAKAKRDWLLQFEDWADTFEKWFATIGAICIGVCVIGLPILLVIADHVSVLNVLSGP